MVEERPLSPWIDEIPKGAFISYDPGYPQGKYLDRFKTEELNGLKYYFYDPTEYGFKKGEEYSILIYLHGTSNSLVGNLCINYTGAEMFASDDYQKKLGGAYILVPVANEYKEKNGTVRGYWDESYIDPVIDMIETVIKEKTSGVKVKILLGNNAGGKFSFMLSDRRPDLFDVVVPIGAVNLPDADYFEKLDEHSVTLLYADAVRDEVAKREKDIIPKLPLIEKMKHGIVFTPEWVRNGDKGIASISQGIEIGQHCLMNAFQLDMMFSDGTPMDPMFPNGVTGWMAQEIARRNAG